MSHSQALQALIPLELGAVQQADVVVEGRQLDRSEADATLLLREMFPDNTVDYLTTWEKLLGVIPASDAKRSERINEILYRLRSLGRLDIQFFIDIAATVGYAITIIELKPLMAGWAQSGQEVMAEYVRWIWCVTISDGFTQYARAGAAAAGEPIEWYRDKRHLDDIFNDLKPAHTLVIFV